MNVLLFVVSCCAFLALSFVTVCFVCHFRDSRAVGWVRFADAIEIVGCVVGAVGFLALALSTIFGGEQLAESGFIAVAVTVTAMAVRKLIRLMNGISFNNESR